MRGRTIGLGVVCYVALRVTIAVWVGPHWHPDTIGYADYPVSFTGNAPRPWLVTLVQHALTDYGVVVLQAVVSGVAFCVLAVAIGATIEDRRVRYGMGGLVLLLGLAPRITAWDTMLLSESLAVSLSALLLACLIHLERVPWWAVGLVFTLWVFTRESHWFLAVMLLPAVGWWAWRKRRIALPVVMVAAFVWSAAAYNNDDSTDAWGISANLAWYAGTDVETFRWFIDHGMPPSDGFTYRTLKDRVDVLFLDPEFREWAGGDGVRVYAEYLATHPRFLFGEAFGAMFDPPPFDTNTLLDHETFYMAETAGPPVWPRSGVLYTALLVAAAGLAGLQTWRAGRIDRRWLLPIALIGSTIPHALLVYHVAPTELGRKGTLMAFVVVLACWWIVALALDLKAHDVAVDGAGVGGAERGVLTLIETGSSTPTGACDISDG